MLRRRGRALLLPATLLVVVVVVAGCGRDDFNNDPRPPIPAEISVKIARDGVAVPPKAFGGALANITVANLTNETGSLAIRGPVDTASEAIAPGDADTIKLAMK